MNLGWYLFSQTGNIDAYLLSKELETGAPLAPEIDINIEKEEAEDKDGYSEDKRDNFKKR